MRSKTIAARRRRYALGPPVDPVQAFVGWFLAVASLLLVAAVTLLPALSMTPALLY